MEITTTTTYDLPAITALTRLSLFKKADPKKRMTTIMLVYLVLLPLLIWMSATSEDSSTWILLLILFAVFMGTLCILYFDYHAYNTKT